MTGTLQLMGYTADIAENLFEKMNGKPDRQRAFMVYDGCALISMLKDMLIAGAGYEENSEDMEQSEKDGGGIKQIRLSRDDELHMETITANVRQLKKDILDAADPKLYLELSAAEKKSEKAVEKNGEDDEKKRAEYDLWRSRSEKEYLAADKRIVLFGIMEKTAPVMSSVMLVMFAAELMAFSESFGSLIAAAVLFAAAGGVFGILKKSAVKKKGSYSKVIDKSKISIRTAEKDFAE